MAAITIETDKNIKTLKPIFLDNRFITGLSLLERYMEQILIYQRKPKPYPPYDKRVITKLLQNYRSHEDILHLPNKMFYEGELKVCADQMMRNCLSDWEVLPKKGCPVIFHGVIGQDMREERSPSFFNAEEASEVLKYVTKLLTEKRGGYKVKPSDIGIISPYRKQVCLHQRTLSMYHIIMLCNPLCA